jgi:ParB-like chromosome segregation protein Spo0J
MKITEIKTRAPFNEIFAISERIVEKIAAHIKTYGFDESQPIVLWDEEGVVVDGHTRFQAAIRCGLEEVPVYLKSFADEEEALAYAIHNQRHRRNLTDAEILRCIEAVDKRKQQGERTDLAQPCAKLSRGKSSEQTARMLGVSARKVEQTRAVIDDRQAAEDVKAGRKSINRAYQETQAKRETHPSRTKNREDNGQAILQKALDEIRPWKEKYKDYRELSAIFVAIDGCHLNLERMKGLPKPEEPPHASESLEPCPPLDGKEEGKKPCPPDADNDELPRHHASVDSADKPSPSSDKKGNHELNGPATADLRTSGKGGDHQHSCRVCRKFIVNSDDPGKGSCEKYQMPFNPGISVSCNDFEPKDPADINDPSQEVPAQMEVGQVENAVG